MGVNRVTKRGKERIEVRKTWPDGTTLRRYYPDEETANEIYHEVELAIARGNWRELKKRLAGKADKKLLTIREFSDTYIEDYCQIHNTDVKNKERHLRLINQRIGKLPVREFERGHAHELAALWGKNVRPATVNRRLATLSHMLTYALERGLIQHHPMLRFRKLREETKPLRVMTLDQERRLVDCVAEENPVVGAYVALLGETGLRKAEGLRLTWADIDRTQKMVTVEKSKSGRPRYVPLSDFALDWLDRLVRWIDKDEIFINPKTGRVWKDPRYAFNNGKEKAQLEWVKGFHDLRHFRATQWLRSGIDIRTVKELLGHSTIQTTMRYLHLVDDRFDIVRQAQARETFGRHYEAASEVAER